MPRSLFLRLGLTAVALMMYHSIATANALGAFGFPPKSFATTLAAAQAGAHSDLTVGIEFNSEPNPYHGGGRVGPFLPDGNPKDIEVSLPPGLIGNARAIAQCLPQQLKGDRCPIDSQVGLVVLNFGGAPFGTTYPVYNVAPQSNAPAELGLFVIVAPVFINVHVDSVDDYRVASSLTNITEALPLIGSTLTLWGVPAEARHDFQRYNPVTETFGTAATAPRLPFLTSPTACQDEEPDSVLVADSWQEPGIFAGPANASIGQINDCNQLVFHPFIELQPDAAQAGAPVGDTVRVHIPQNEDPAGLATPTLRDATLTLPLGITLSPTVADGLQACTDEAFGLHTGVAGNCPSASQLATVLVHTPDLSTPLEGRLFVGQPNCGPCSAADAASGKLVRLFLEAEGSGVVVKLEGHGTIGQGTGTLSTTFKENPQLPFEDLTVTLKGGPRAPLANPRTCGLATTTSDLTPWSSPFTPDATPTSTFEVTGCGPAQFHPTLSAGTTSNQAAGFSPFVFTLTRADSEEDLSRITLHTPPGLLGMLSKVQLCEEPQAAQGNCPAASQIGHVIAGVGTGSDPLYVPQAGKPQDPVYLTGPYHGAPFGLSVVVPAEAGPFNLGTVVVRSTIGVDPHTAQITIASDPLPTQRYGIPLHVRAVHVEVDREGFIFNPTNCEPLALTGAVTSSEGMGAPLSTHFQAVNCATLPFAPSFTSATKPKTSKADGTALEVKVGYPKGPQANIRSVKVTLPKQLPARLTTLQQACTEATFAANPAACPAASNVGTVTVTTPVLNVPLTGPAYLVSHGGAAFPDLVFVLQGQGVTLDLVGNTSIKKGITTSTFAAVPDAPVSSVDVKLPQGSHSALTSNLPSKARGSFCSTKLNMPTRIVGQNGAQIAQTTRIAVTGCAKRKARKASRRASGQHRHA